MDMLKQEKNRGYVIAGGAAIIAFIAYFLPYFGFSETIPRGVFTPGSTTSYSFSGSVIGSWLFFELLGAIIAIAVAAILIFRSNVLSGVINMPVEKQTLYARYTLVGAGALALLIHLLFLLTYSSYLGNGFTSGDPNFSSGLSFGWFLFLVAALAMVVGAVMALRTPIPAYTATPYSTQTQYPPYQQPYPTTDQQQYPPYQGQPPQQQPYQQQYPAQPTQYAPPPQQQQYGQPQQPYQAPPQQYPQADSQQPPQQYPPQQR